MPFPFKPQLIALVVSASVSSATFAEETTMPQTMGFAEALESARQHDSELQYAYYNYLGEQEADDISMSALLPTVSLSSSYRYQYVRDIYTDKFSSAYSESLARSEKDQDDYNFQLRMQQSLVNVAAWKDYSSSKQAVRKSEFTYQRAEQELIYRLSQAYLKALLASQQVYINQDKLAALQLKLEQTQRMEELGVGDRLSVLKVASTRDIARSDLLQAQSEYEDAQTKLNVIAGTEVVLPENWVQHGHQVIPDLQTGTQQDWINKVPDNTELLAEMANVRGQELQAESRQAAHLPTLDLSLRAIDSKSDDIYVDSTNYIASIDLTIPLYTGGKTSSRYRQAEATYNAAQARYEKTLSDITQTVKLAYAQLNSYRGRLEALDESRKSSQAFLEAAERQADLSLSSQVDVLEARTDLYDVRLKFARTLADYLLSDLNLLLETGQLTEHTLEQYDELFSRTTL
ncbi:TolC family protein [Marinomonas ostreistagni]|uniref:TolC family protein n=1 Tax=Marinomonas ostreistagni TaxID=359209 RepID=A0ABS0ZD04_9GAMM|nr:TolC family protein [Marinomonas ostreistagni]MBJ7551519.1 TolC family protein [Marinomonas ostreistagni]